MGQGSLSPRLNRDQYLRRLRVLLGSSLLRYWPLQESSGLVVLDKSLNAGHGVYDAGHMPTLYAPGISPRIRSVKFIADTFANVYSTALRDAWTPEEITFGCLFKCDAAWWADGVQHNLCYFRSDASNLRGLYKTPTNVLTVANMSGATNKVVSAVTFTGMVNWMSLIATVSKSNDRARLFINGSQYSADITSLGAYAAVLLASTYANLGNYSTSHAYAAAGWQSDFFVATRELTRTEISKVANPFKTPTRTYFAIGDSKTANNPNWGVYFNDLVFSIGRPWVKLPIPYADGGWTTQTVKDGIDAAIAARSEIPDYVIINLGANDVSGATPAADWKVNTDYILDACHAAYPAATIYLTKIWRRNTGFQAANIAIINVYIDELVAAHSPWLKVGVNEGNFLPAADDGATNTSDGIHPNAAGCVLWAAAMLARL